MTKAIRRRWEARRKMIADDFFSGDEQAAEMVLDSLPYSTVPDWPDVATLMQAIDRAGLLCRCVVIDTTLNSEGHYE